MMSCDESTCPGRKECRRLHFRNRHHRVATLLHLKETLLSFCPPKPALLFHFAKQIPKDRERDGTLLQVFSRIIFYFLCIALFLTQKIAYSVEVTESYKKLCRRELRQSSGLITTESSYTDV